jgi:hypothetical protein
MSDRPEPTEAERVAAADAEHGPTAEGADDADEGPDARAMRALLKRSLARDVENAPHLLAGVQHRIRVRSRGKFFADGWSTTQARASYALVGILTLLLVALAYLMLGPIDFR